MSHFLSSSRSGRGMVMKPGMPVILGALLLAASGLTATASAAGIEGQWRRGDGKARVNIAPCGADICATNTWIKPGTPREKAGDKLVMSVKPASGGGYSGTAFDPQRDRTYSLTITISGDQMTTRGCIVAGLLCRGIDWTRIN